MHWFPIQPENPNEKVWRYMDLPKFIYLLDSKKLYLPSAERLGDKHEGSVFWFQKETEQKVCAERGLMDTIPTIAEIRQAQPKCTFISCWHKINSDSHAMWKIYCGSKQGVAITTSYLKLSNFVNLGLYAMGCVTYDNSDPLPDNFIAQFMQKRKAFTYEQEVRIVANLFTCPEFWKNGKFCPSRDHLTIPVTLAELIEKIYVHPEADNHYFQAVESLVLKHAPEMKDRVEWSEMRNPPAY